MGAGRPFKEIDWEEFDKLCAIQCTQAELASWFDCCRDTIDAAVLREKGVPYQEYYAEKAGKGRVSLRRMQYQMALKGDKTMLIWLGKQYLGQVERSQIDISKVPDDIFIAEAERRVVLDTPRAEIEQTLKLNAPEE